jgi:hypothetical protein
MQAQPPQGLHPRRARAGVVEDDEVRGDDVGDEVFFGRRRDLEASRQEARLQEGAIGSVGADDERVAILGLVLASLARAVP